MADNTPEGLSDPYWDLFPEDNISGAVREANKELSSRSKASMKEASLNKKADMDRAKMEEERVRRWFKEVSPEILSKAEGEFTTEPDVEPNFIKWVAVHAESYDPVLHADIKKIWE